MKKKDGNSALLLSAVVLGWYNMLDIGAVDGYLGEVKAPNISTFSSHTNTIRTQSWRRMTTAGSYE